MRASALLSALLLGSLTLATSVEAQRARPQPVPVGGFVVPELQLEATAQEAPSLERRVLTALASTALGAGIGFFASQLARGDWDDGPGQPQINRTGWAAIGGSVGFAVGLSFPIGGGGDPMRGSLMGEGPLPSHLVITAEQMEELVAQDAYEAVSILRPEWLVLRPARALAAGLPGDHPAGGTLTESRPVYLDDFRLGDVDDLRGLSVQQIAAIRLVSASVATARWGPGNSNGVIQVLTRD